MSLSIPINIKLGTLTPAKDVRSSIDQFLHLLISTPCDSFVADPEFGFIFNNFKFEIFDEKDGIIFNSVRKRTDNATLYDKKISGMSKNFNTFASELSNAVMRYEKRLTHVDVTMEYNRNLRNIHVVVRGEIVDTREKYEFEDYIRVWN